jgi:hypothetical protein
MQKQCILLININFLSGTLLVAKRLTETDPQAAALEVIPLLDEISPTMCMAKWLWSSIHLTTGLTNSCFLPPLHKIDAHEVEQNFKALHNTI